MSKHRICWATDIHLDHLVEWHPSGRRFSERKVAEFCAEIKAKNPDSLVITGDISTAPNLEVHLTWLEKGLPEFPIYFVLGNHDYYNGSFADLRARLAHYNAATPGCMWLNATGVVKLTEKTALIGHDGWYDGGYSDWFKSRLVMNEYHIVKEFAGKSQKEIFAKMQDLARECAAHIKQNVAKAVAGGFSNIVFATHVPPFRENSRAPDGSLSDIDWLPNMSSKMAGDALLRAAGDFPGVNFTSLSGHTHTKSRFEPKANLVSLTGQASYGSPEVSIQVFEIE